MSVMLDYFWDKYDLSFVYVLAVGFGLIFLPVVTIERASCRA